MKKILLKNIYTLIAAMSITSIYSQEYNRVWGTYFGPARTDINGTFTNLGIVLDSQKNMHLRGHIWNSSAYTTSYYNQFIIGNGGNYNIQNNQDIGFSINLNSFGTPNYFGYTPLSPVNDIPVELLFAIDNQDNKLMSYYGTPTFPQNATPGTWLQTNPQISTKSMLIKRNSLGNVIWATYLPDNQLSSNAIIDSDGNIYVTGRTLEQNISTPGVFQENFDIIYSQGNILENNYLAKLNPNGELIWATYLPAANINMQYYDNAIYMITGRNTNTALNTLATAGAFQSGIAESSITKINTTNGQRSWGTYYGPSISTSIYFVYDLAVNETGIYLTGTDYNLNNSNFFATPNAHKTQVTGTSDLFLTKFSHAGDRLWSTYFGGNGEELNLFDKVIDVNGGEIFITGITAGSTDNIATVGSYQDAPQSNSIGANNSFFAKFNSSGGLEWSSYYGGSSTQSTYMKSINIKYDNNSLFLFGSTNSNIGYATENAFMPTRNPNTTSDLTGFFAKFNKKETLSVNDLDKEKNLVLYNNPNNGVFNLTGNILQNESCTMVIYDISGKLIVKKDLDRKKDQQFDLQNHLSSGNYLIQINNNKGEKFKTFKMTVKK